MKIIFNDATEITVQQAELHGDYLRVLTVGNTPEQLKELFTDSSRISRMIVQERGQTIATYEGYTTLYRIEWSPGGIYTVVMYKQEKTPEEKVAALESELLDAKEMIDMLTGCILEMSELVYQ